jgi:hypothetical protein
MVEQALDNSLGRVLGTRTPATGVVDANKVFPGLTADQAMREILEFGGVFSRRRIQGTGLKVRMGKLLPQTFRSELRIRLTNLMERLEARKARRQIAPIRLHLGCGNIIKRDFINVDLWGLPDIDLAWNLAHTPLPWTTGSVELVFHEHVQEHMAQMKGLALAKDVYRMLKPGGVYRFAVPDPALHYAAYGDATNDFFTRFMTFKVDIDALNQLHYGERHVHMYDQYGGTRLLVAAGFKEINVCGPGESGFLHRQSLPDTEWRAINSLYFEARK